MITLEDISTERLFVSFKDPNSILYGNGFISRAFNSCYIKDYQQLEELINSSNPNFDNGIFRIQLEIIKDNINYANQLGINPQFFNCDNYSGIVLDRKTIKATEGKTFCRQLIINDPITGPSEKLLQIASLRIVDAKMLLGKVVAHDKEVVGKNAFLDIYSNFTQEDVIKLKNAINFYEKQIICQYFETGKRGVCLFGINKEEREEIIKNNIRDIVDYIVNNADECVWGKLTFEQKKLLISAIKSKKDMQSSIIIGRLINLFSNYTTLNEIKDGIKTKTLDRFIVK